MYVVCTGAFAGWTGGGGMGPCREGGGTMTLERGDIDGLSWCCKPRSCWVGVRGGEGDKGVEGGDRVLKRELVDAIGEDVAEELVEEEFDAALDAGIVSG